MAKFSIETIKEIWDDDHGTRLEVGPDRDGLGLIEIRSIDEKRNIDGRLTFLPEQAALVAHAIMSLLSERKA